MSRHDDTVYLRQMLDHARTALALSEGKDRSDLETEPALRYALLHLLCILGEAANRVSVEGKRKYDSLPWRDIISMRNMLIHGYDVVDLDMLWKTVLTDIPTAIHSLRESLGEMDSL